MSVPAGNLTTFRTALTNAAAALPAGNTWKDAFTKLADAGLAVNNRFLTSTIETFIWSVNHKNTALRDAALAVLANATGLP